MRMKTREHSVPGEIPCYIIAAFFALLLAALWGITRVEWLPDGHLELTSPHVTFGDEPHHLLVLNSILFDHDLELQDDYKRAILGPDAGGIYLPDHHTIIVNRRTGRHGIWVEDHTDPDFAPGPDVYEVSSHPIAYPALLAALIFPFHPKMEDVQSDASLVMVLICWLGAIFTFLLARKVGMGRGFNHRSLIKPSGVFRTTIVSVSGEELSINGITIRPDQARTWLPLRRRDDRTITYLGPFE
jgi:hypothetical protein